MIRMIRIIKLENVFRCSVCKSTLIFFDSFTGDMQKCMVNKYGIQPGQFSWIFEMFVNIQTNI